MDDAVVAGGAPSKVAAKMPPRSSGHVCFARKISDGSWLATTMSAEAQVEFFVDSLGACLMRADVQAAIGPTGARTNETVCATSASDVEQICRKIGSQPPSQVVARLAQEVQRSTKQGEGTAGVTKGRGIMSKTGKTVAGAWAELFEQNEARAKAGEKPWTDEKLCEKMQAQFDGGKDKSTLNRPSMYRSCFNNGTYMYEKAGKPKVKSNRYGDDGNVIEPGHRMSAEAAAAKTAPKEGEEKVTIAELERRKRQAAKGKKGKGGGKKVRRKK